MRKEGILVEEKNWMELFLDQNQIPKVLEMNQKTESFGLILSEEDAKALVENQKKELRKQQRVEFGEGILPKLIFTFCDSAYINQEDYVDTLMRLQEIFYLYQNEIPEEISDEELLQFMREQYEDVCRGDLEYLESTCLYRFARALRAGKQDYQKMHGYGGYARAGKTVRGDYKMEELIPIVAKLAEKYTSKERTSVSYEVARQLMGAVLYCINQGKSCGQLASQKRLTAQEAYQYGYECLIEKVKRTQELYNRMIPDFCAYGNENYQATVEKAIPEFFRYYDARFAPQETIITMDYPTICPIVELSGIDAIARYVEFISYEQKFLSALPREYVSRVLQQFHSDYREHFFNICNIVLRHILCHMLIGKPLGEKMTEEDDATIKAIIGKQSREELEKTMSGLIHDLICRKYGSDLALENYLQKDSRDFVVELRVAAEHNSFRMP